MKLCNNGHSEIVYSGKYSCPLCQLVKHNNLVHDFIEQDPELVKKLVKYLEDKETDK